MASPKPRPAALKLIEGRGKGRDSGGRAVKTPPPFVRLPPVAPDWLSPEAIAEWDRVVPELQRLEITKEIDAAALAAYCEIWSLFRSACESVRADGLTVTNTGKDGAEQHAPNPTVGVMLKAAAQLRAWCGEFGLTPSSEMRITKPEVPNAGQAENPFG